MVQLLSLGIRTLHVLAVALLVGATAAVWHRLRYESTGGLALAERYEWAFWAAVGLLVLTGVGNLGAIGVPGPSTDWGRTLVAKLVLVLAVVCGSAVRTLVVVRTGERTDGGDVPAPVRRTLGRAYGATTGLLLAVVVLAEVLAHG